MSRYTGSTYRKSRRLGFSILENGKELAKRPYSCMVLMKNNLEKYLMMQVN